MEKKPTACFSILQPHLQKKDIASHQNLSRCITTNEKTKTFCTFLIQRQKVASIINSIQESRCHQKKIIHHVLLVI